MEAYILDAIGSLTVEKAMDKIQENLIVEMSAGSMKISNRYSPGYCNWHLSGQKSLFGLIDENPTGIQINDSCLMTPRKSISGIIGIGKDLKHHEYGCAVCNNATCIYRRILHSAK
jgi:cobalamin-dependent methionine synthase I